MIYLTLRGGLGNQMFQYSLARRISLSTRQKIVIDLSSMNNDAQRECKLNYTSIPRELLNFQDARVFQKWNPDRNVVLKVVLKLFPRRLKKILFSRDIYIYGGEEFQEVHPTREDTYLYGWWQSERYMEQYTEQIKNELEIKPTQRIQDKYDLIRSTPNTVCLHYRMGDYLLPKNRRFQVCSPEYYFKGMKYMREMLDSPRFYVFSDDIEKAQALFGNHEDIEYIKGQYSDTEEFSLMTSCSNFIMSNSTFSWWAQYLSWSKHKLVVAPKFWTKDHGNSEIYQNNWKLFS